MDFTAELVTWTEEYMNLVHADYRDALPRERQILENARLLIMNNAACHLAHLAPLEFLYMLPDSKEYFFSTPLSWWAKEGENSSFW